MLNYRVCILRKLDEGSLNTIGESSELSPHAAVVVKLSVLTAWAELYLSSSTQNYLVEVVEPWV
jgi:hypothetical protein